MNDDLIKLKKKSEKTEKLILLPLNPSFGSKEETPRTFAEKSKKNERKKYPRSIFNVFY